MRGEDDGRRPRNCCRGMTLLPGDDHVVVSLELSTCRLEHDLSVVSPLLGDLPLCEPTVKVLGPDHDQLLDRPDQPRHNLGPLDDQRVLRDLRVVNRVVAAIIIIAAAVAIAIAVTLRLTIVTVGVGVTVGVTVAVVVVSLGLGVVVVAATTLYKIKGWTGMRVGRGVGTCVKARAMKLGTPRLCPPLCLCRSNGNEMTAGRSQRGILGTLQRRVQRQPAVWVWLCVYR